MFKKYFSLTNSNKQAFINKIQYNNVSLDDWYVTEKIHGANFSVIVNESGEVDFASRIRVLPSYEAPEFYNVGRTFLRELAEKANRALRYLDDGTIKYIQIYGELFGGHYDHPDVPKSPTRKIQKGVQYSPDHHFMMFDILVRRHFDERDIYINHDALRLVSESCGIQTMPVLFRGTMSDCLNYNSRFNSMVPRMLGMPELESNLCEGIVVRPVSHTKVGESTVAMKVVNEEFSEKTHTKIIVMPDSTELTKSKTMVDSYINVNRMESAASKVGELVTQNIGKILREMVTDIMTEYAEDHPELIDLLDKVERKSLTKYVQSKCSIVIRSNLID